MLEHAAPLLLDWRVGPLQLDISGFDMVCFYRGLLQLGCIHHIGPVDDVCSDLADHLGVFDQLLLRQGFALIKQFLLLALVHLGVEQHQLPRLLGRWGRDLLR